MNTTTIEQSWRFETTAKELYNMLMDEETYEDFCGSQVTMDPVEGGEFTVFDGYIMGQNIELVPHTKIVQEWNFAEDGWPEDHFSLCTFLFEEQEGQTLLTFTQTGVPEHVKEALENGWRQYYWEPMENYISGNS